MCFKVASTLLRGGKELNQICASNGEPRQFWGSQITECDGRPTVLFLT